MDTLNLGSDKEKIEMTFLLLDLSGKSQVTKDDYESFITSYLSMYEEMTEC